MVNRIDGELSIVGSYFGLLALAGFGLACLSALGLVIELKRIDHAGDNEIAGYNLTRGPV